MTFPKARLVVSACLFFGWLGFLCYLVVSARTIVLSKPQFLVAQLYVVVEASAGIGGDASPDASATVAQVLWSARDVDHNLRGEVVLIPELAECSKDQGYRGKGKYLLPLIKSGDVWKIAPLPARVQRTEKIYRWAPDTEAQVNQLIAAKN
jgi:hypothetical protein